MSATRCRQCNAEAELFICTRCQNRLEAMLRELPWWLARLEETATGQAKLGSRARRTPRYRQVLDGDAHPLAPYPDDDEPDLAKARTQRDHAVLRDALARGRVNLRAVELADYANSVLVEWVRDICETRGVDIPAL